MHKQNIILADPPFVPLLGQIARSAGWVIIPVTNWATAESSIQSFVVPPPLTVVVRAHLDTMLFQRLDTWSQKHNTCWVPFHLDQGSGWLGPLIVPKTTATYHDLLVRRCAVAESNATFHALTALPEMGTQDHLPPHAELTWMLSVLFTELERWRETRICQLLSAEIEADPVALMLRRYPVLPLPDRQLQGFPDCRSTGADVLVNARSGIIIRTVEVEHVDFVPNSLRTVQTHVAYMGWHNPNWQNDTICGGSTFGNRAHARQAAIGEAVERYCGSTMGTAQPIRATYNQLLANGEYALDPEQLVLFSDRVYQRPNCSLKPFSRDTVTYWVRGYSLTREQAAWLPVSLVYFNWDRRRFRDLPLTNWLNYAGIAAGQTQEHALVSAIEELIERDTTMVWWYNRPSLPALHLPAELQQLWHRCLQQHGQRAWAIHLPNEFNIPVIAGVVDHTREQLLTIGFACRPDPAEATCKSWSEALILEESAYDLTLQNGRADQSVRAGWLPDVYKPWRADRMYLDDCRADFSDVRHLMTQLQIALDPSLIQQIRPWVDLPARYHLIDIPTLPDRSLATYRQRLEARGYELFFTDITLPDIALTGLCVVRVIIPGLVPNTPAAFPPLGRERIQQTAVQLGWRHTPLQEDELNYLPMPHA